MDAYESIFWITAQLRGVRLALADVLIQAGKFDHARLQLETCRAALPDSARILEAVGNLELRQGRLPQAAWPSKPHSPTLTSTPAAPGYARRSRRFLDEACPPSTWRGLLFDPSASSFSGSRECSLQTRRRESLPRRRKPLNLSS